MLSFDLFSANTNLKLKPCLKSSSSYPQVIRLLSSALPITAAPRSYSVEFISILCPDIRRLRRNDGTIVSDEINKDNIPVVRCFHEYYDNQDATVQVSKITFAPDTKIDGNGYRVRPLRVSGEIFEGQADRNGRHYVIHRLFTSAELEELSTVPGIEMRELYVEQNTYINSRKKQDIHLPLHLISLLEDYKKSR